VTAAGRTDASRGFVLAHLLGCSFAWGCSFLFMKLIAGDLPPLVIASIRATLAALALMAFVVVLRQSVLPKGREWQDWLVLGTVNGWIPNILVAFALERLDSGPAALIQASTPLMTAVLGHLFLTQERLTMDRVVGILIGFLGVTILIGPKALDGTGTALAVAAMLVMSFGYAAGNIYTRMIPRAEPIRLALGQQAASAVISTILMLAWLGPSAYRPAVSHAGPLLALALFSTALPIWLFMRMITRTSSTRAAMTGYLVPATAVTMGVLVLGEPIVPRQILGGLIVLIGVAIVTGLVRLPIRRAA
jgi:drug/metabolite transporter (DMT)-like permease